MESSMGNEIYHDNRFAVHSFVQVSLLTPTVKHCVTVSSDVSQLLSCGPQSNSASDIRYAAIATTIFSAVETPIAFIFKIVGSFGARSGNWHKINLSRF